MREAYPFLCQPVSLYVNPGTMLALPLGGNPASLCLPIPANPALAGGALCFQAMAQSPGGCLNASDGVLLRILAD